MRTCKGLLVGSAAVLVDGIGHSCCIGRGGGASSGKGVGQGGCCGLRVACSSHKWLAMLRSVPCVALLYQVQDPVLPGVQI